MHNNRAYKEILGDYDRLRQEAAYVKNRRLLEVYGEIPRIQEIDRELHLIGPKISKTVLDGDMSKLEEYQNLTQALTQEKNQLMEKSNFQAGYLTDIYKCSKCSDTGFISGQRCACFSQKLIDLYYSQSNLKAVLDKENFDTFDLRYYSEEVYPDEGISPRDNAKGIYQTCIEFVLNFGHSFTNLLFYGKPGLGKTFLLNCIAKDILDKGRTVLYVTSSQLFKTIEDARFNRDELEEPAEQINAFYTVDLLAIDDLGTEFSTIVTESEFFNIINDRLLQQKPTVISTNLNPKAFTDQYSDRIISRLMGDYKFCKFIGEDIRAIKKYAFLQS